MARFLEHPSRTARWAGESFEVLPAAEAEDVTVWFVVEAGTGGRDSEPVWEGLLGKRLGQDRVEIAAVPAFVYDVNLGDEVAVMASREGALVATGLVRDARRYTFRVFFDRDAAPHPDERWRDLHLALARFGCWLDVYAPTLVAVSAEAAVARDVAGYLADEERAGRLQYETGRSVEPGADGHPRRE